MQERGDAMGKSKAVWRSIAALPLALYGYAFSKAGYSMQSGLYFSVADNTLTNIIGLINAAVGVILAGAALKYDSQRFRKALLLIGVGAGFCSLILLGICHMHPGQPPWVVLASRIGQSISMILVSSLWISCYAYLNPTRTTFLNAACILAAEALMFMTEQSDIARYFLFVSVFLSLGVVVYVFAQKTNPEQETSSTLPSESKHPLFPYKAALFVAMYSFAYGFATMTANVQSAIYAAAIPSIFIILFILFGNRRFSVASLCRLVLPLMIGGFLLTSLMLDLVFPVPSILLDTGFSTMELLLLLMVFTIAYSTGVSAIFLFGALSATQFFFRFVGLQLGRFMSSSPLEGGYVAAVVIVSVLIVIASLLLINEKSLLLTWVPSMPGASNASENDTVDTDVRINLLCTNHNLTDRESEVLRLLVKGKTNRAIARDMFISEGTVKAHVSHIYQKIGVHTRKELKDLAMGSSN